MDEADLGNHFADLYLQGAIRKQREVAALMKGESAEICDICGDPIPQARRRAKPGCLLCIDCQTEQEEMNSWV